MKLIDGKLIARELKRKLQEEIVDNNLNPKLAIIMVGNNAASEIYIKNKVKTCEELGIKVNVYRFNESNNENDIINKIKELNADQSVHGILVQSPLPAKFNEDYIISFIDELKDVDGFGTYNLGCLARDEEKFIAATPYGIIKMLEYENIPIAGKHIVILGRSKIVGRPLALALLNRNATVTIAHSKTNNLKEITTTADILIVAIGKANYITKDYIKDNAVIIDVGINRIDGKIYGDVDFQSVKDKASYITPVPGGVGPMTITMLLYNVVLSAKKKRGENKRFKFFKQFS